MINKDIKFKDIKFKVERNIVKNLFYFIVFFFAIILYQTNAIKDLSLAQKKITAEMQKNLNSYVALTEDGIPITLPREYVGAKYNKEIIKNALLDLVVSRAEISNNFQISKFDKVTDIVKHSEKLSTFATEYILLHKELLKNLDISKEDMKKIEEENKKGLRYFTAYLKYINTLFIADKLPHKVDILKTKVLEYKTEGNKFSIKVTVNVIVDRFAGQTKDGKVLWDTKKGTTTLGATGYFDIRLRTRAVKGLKGINTRGLRFTSLAMKYSI